MRNTAVVLVTIIVAASSMNVRAQTSDCEAMSKAIDVELMNLSALDGIFDNSAPRETNRLLRKSVAAQVIQANLTLMQANRCTLPKQPITEMTYRSDASACALAQEKVSAPPECDRSKWVKDYLRTKSALPVAGSNGLAPATNVATAEAGVGLTYRVTRTADTYTEPSESSSPSVPVVAGKIVQVHERYQDFARISADGAPPSWLKISLLERIK